MNEWHLCLGFGAFVQCSIKIQNKFTARGCAHKILVKSSKSLVLLKGLLDNVVILQNVKSASKKELWLLQISLQDRCRAEPLSFEFLRFHRWKALIYKANFRVQWRSQTVEYYCIGLIFYFLNTFLVDIRIRCSWLKTEFILRNLPLVFQERFNNRFSELSES
jgi:hypothetical protein